MARQVNCPWLCFTDTPGKMDVANPVAEDADGNMGLKTRYTFTRKSHIVDMTSFIHTDIFFQE